MNVLAFGDRAGRHMYDRGDWFSVGMIVMLLVLGALVALAVWLLTRSRRGSGGAAPAPAPAPLAAGAADAAIDLARLRYARGEMGRDHYLQTVADLGGASFAAPTAAATSTVTTPADVPAADGPAATSAVPPQDS